MFPSKMMPTKSPFRFTTGLPLLPPTTSAVVTKLNKRTAMDPKTPFNFRTAAVAADDVRGGHEVKGRFRVHCCTLIYPAGWQLERLAIFVLISPLIQSGEIRKCRDRFSIFLVALHRAVREP